MKQWLPEDDLVYFIMDVVKQVDLRKIYRPYELERRGQPPYNPTMMVGLLLYAYAVGVPSSRKIEQATYHSIPFRVLTANQHPDHDTIADFRKRHLKTLAGLFVQVLRLCQKAGLVKFGHIALDGTKVKANASAKASVAVNSPRNFSSGKPVSKRFKRRNLLWKKRQGSRQLPGRLNMKPKRKPTTIKPVVEVGPPKLLQDRLIPKGNGILQTRIRG
jgi:transposase